MGAGARERCESRVRVKEERGGNGEGRLTLWDWSDGEGGREQR